MSTLTPEQAKTLRPVTPEEHERLSRGRPRKPPEERTEAISLRIEPSLLLKLKRAAVREKCPWQTYLKILVARALEVEVR